MIFIFLWRFLLAISFQEQSFEVTKQKLNKKS